MKKLSVITICMLLLSPMLHAVPAWRKNLTWHQGDGTVLTYYLKGDEWGHVMLSSDGYLLGEDEQGNIRYASVTEKGPVVNGDAPIAHNPELRAEAEREFLIHQPKAADLNIDAVMNGMRRAGTKASAYQIGTFPTKGDAHGLVILADFMDKAMTYDHEYHRRLMNEHGFSEDGNDGSARDFFIDQSMGQFQPTFDVVGPVHLQHNVTYYGRNDTWYNQDTNAEQMIVDACNIAHDEMGVDFSKYDYDDDGKVDMVYVIFAGYGENAGGGANTVWPKKWNLTLAGYDLRLDGKIVDVFACSAELFGNTGGQSSSIGTFCHEFGHVLGFADHYSTTNSSKYQLGSYDLMDYGSYNNDSRTPPSYNAFERMTVGWMEVEELTTAQDHVMLQDIQTSNKAYRISTKGNPNEFYLLENRQLKGWDSYLPSYGLMITHVDFDMNRWNANTVNTDDAQRRFYLVCADNEAEYDVVAGHYTEQFDLFPLTRNNEFTDYSTPAAKPYTGERLDRWVTNIQLEDSLVSFDFMNNHLKTPVQLMATDINNSGFTARWENRDDRTEEYTLVMSHLRPMSALKYVTNEDFSAVTKGSNNNPDSEDISANLDDFMKMKGWTGCQVYQAGGAICLGKVKTDGSMKSSKIDFSKFERHFAVLVKVNSQVGQQPVFTVTANGQSAKHRLTSTPRMYLYQFMGSGLTATDITLDVKSERAYIDSLIIMRGDDAAQLYPNAKVVSVTGDVASTIDEDVEETYYHAEQSIFEHITDTYFVIDGLEKGERYGFRVMAVGNDMVSEYSPEVVALIDNELGICPVSIMSSKKSMYTLGGVKVEKPDSPGVYIIRENGETKKVLIR